MPEPKTADQIAENIPCDPETIERCRDLLICAGADPYDMTDDEIVQRTARVIVVLLEFCRKMTTVLHKEVGAAIQRYNVVINEHEQRNPALAVLMSAERQRMEVDR